MIHWYRNSSNWYAGAIYPSVNTRILTLIGRLWISGAAFSQDIEFVKQHVKILSSEAYYGRGYINKGDAIAAQYLANEFARFRLNSFGKDYFQYYQFDVNTFPGHMLVKIDGKELIPGEDYVVYPASAGMRGTYDIEIFDSTLFTPDFTPQSLLQKNYSEKFILLDTLGWSKHIQAKETYNILNINSVNAKGMAMLSYQDIYFSVSSYQLKYGSFIFKRSALPGNPKNITLNVQSKLRHHKAVNIIGFIPGETDSFMVVTAHYDHLGMMGRSTYFPGANDNASGTAMLLDLVRYYSSCSTPPRYSYAFMLFSGEEAGLLGSAYYTRHPLFPMPKIKMLVNLDMMGTGTDGVYVYFGEIYPNEFHKLNLLNKNNSLNINLIAKGISKRSDHYFFYQNNVPVLYFATVKNNVSYHSPGDTFEALPFTVYENLFKLIVSYFTTF